MPLNVSSTCAHCQEVKILLYNIQITYQILSLLKVILPQNYLMFQQKIYQPAQGITMGSPISSIIAEIFLQHYEDANIKQLLDMKIIALYVRYVNAMLVIYDTTKINLHTINTYINKIHNNVKKIIKFNASSWLILR